jgi:uncharacterized protein YndB with AHSA1/START domain
MDGVLTKAGEGWRLSFDRLIERPAEKVWAALVTPERISDWLVADAVVEPRLGGRYELSFRNGPHQMRGVITRFEPPRLLEFTWPEFEDRPASLVLWELAPEGSGCRLKLTHSFPGRDDFAAYASGWHWHLDALPAAVDGVATPWDRPAWERLNEAYKARISG